MGSESISILGRAAAVAEGMGRYSAMVADLFVWMFRQFPRSRVLSQQMFEIGVRSVPVVALTGAFTGMVLAVQSYQQFAELSIENTVGALVAVSMFQEIGPVLTALMLAGRVGSAMAAELGTMKVTEQVDALRALGGSPVQYLVLPRFLACVLLAPLLTVLSDGFGVLGGWLVGVPLLGVDNYYFWRHAADYVKTWQILAGVGKAFVFGGIIATVCCYKGLHAAQGAEGVGRATTAANVLSCMVILVANFFLAVLIGALQSAFTP